MSGDAIGGAIAAPGEGRRIAKNSMLLAMGHVTALTLGFATTILVTDSLGESRYGLLLGAQRMATLLLVVAQFGLHPLLVREVAARRVEVGTLLGTMLVLRLGLSLIFVGLVVATAQFGGYLPEHRWLLYAVAAVELVGAFAELFVGICEGRERMGEAASVAVLRAAVVFGGVGAATLGDFGLEAIVAAYLAGRVLQLVGAAFFARHVFTGVEGKIQVRGLSRMLEQAVPFFAVGLFYMAMRTLDVTLLTLLAPVVEVSRYGAALNFVDVLVILPTFVHQALLPAFSRLHRTGGAPAIASHTLVIFSALFLPAAVGLGLVADSVVQLYPSGEFDEAAPTLAILAAVLPFVAATTVCATLLTGADRLWAIVRAYAVTVPVQAVGNFLVAPTYGAEGVACVTVFTHALLAVLLLLAVRKLGLRFPVRSVARHVVAALAMAGAVLAVSPTEFVVLPILVGAATYFAVLLTLTPRGSLERMLLQEVWGRVRGG